MNDKQVDLHIIEITRLRREADKLNNDNAGAIMEKVELLARCLVFVGRLSSHLDGYYKRVYSRRKLEYAKAYQAAKSHKAVEAELAVAELREMEADAYENMHRWRNAMSSVTEEIHALKLRLRQDHIVEGAGHVTSQGRAQTQAQAR